MFNFEKLTVYQRTLSFINLIYKTTKVWPKDELFGLTNQVRRAAVSIALNIAEGSSRTKKDFCHFLDLARGSCLEVVAILEIAKNQSYIDEETFKKSYNYAWELSKMISGLKNSQK